MDLYSERTKWNLYCERLESDFRNDTKAPSDWMVPFVPWCGDRYWSARPRILFVGKTVGVFDDPDATLWTSKLRGSQAANSYRTTTKDYVEQRVATFSPSSPSFWLVPFLVAGALLPVETDYGQIAHSIAWSNIWKVNSLHRKNGVPQHKHLKCCCATKGTSDHCRPDAPSTCFAHYSAACLRDEIKILRPEVVLIGVNKLWWTFTECLSAGLQINGNSQKGQSTFPMRLKGDQVAQLSPEFQPKIWITNHFSAWGQNARHGRLILEIRKALTE
jgi:hypothetical protein